jgi:chromosome segregation ATPase
MTDQQILTVVLATVPTMLVVMIGILINNARLGDVNARIGDLHAHMNTRFDDVDHRFNDVDRRFNDVDRRFEEMKEIWRSELHRVEEVLDARLKHLEEG